MSSSLALCIGGPFDGEHHELDDALVEGDITSSPVSTDTGADLNIKLVSYRLTHLHSASPAWPEKRRSYRLLVWVDLPQAIDPFAMLIEGYRGRK